MRISYVITLAALMAVSARAETIAPGNHQRAVMMREQKRTYWVHVPKGLDLKKPVPVVLALHGAMMNGLLMAEFCGLNETSDREGFIVVYPNVTGTGPFLTWNAGGFRGRMAEGRPDDVAFINSLLDDLGTVAKVDAKRVFACGMSNGAIMCYRLAAELSERIAAIAPVAGTIAIDENKPKRPVSVLHFHGTSDRLVPYEKIGSKGFMRLLGAEESVLTWVKLDGCKERPTTDVLSHDGDGLKVSRKTYSGGKRGAEVVLITIQGGGHTWPGMEPMVDFLGATAMNISANDLIWEFFKRHKLR